MPQQLFIHVKYAKQSNSFANIKHKQINKKKKEEEDKREQTLFLAFLPS